MYLHVFDDIKFLCPFAEEYDVLNVLTIRLVVSLQLILLR